MNLNFLFDSGLLGLEYAMLALGVYITFRILNIPDLTVDGSFTFGLSVSAVFSAAGHPFLGLLSGGGLRHRFAPNPVGNPSHFGGDLDHERAVYHQHHRDGQSQYLPD